MMAKGSYARIILATADLDGAFERLRDAGSQIAQGRPSSPAGCATSVRDPAGNLIRVNEVR